MLTRIGLVLSVVFLLGSMAACGGSGSDGIGPFSTQGSTSPDFDFEEDAVDAAAEPEGARDEQGESGFSGQLSGSGFDRRVIRSGELALYVTDVNASVRHARDLADDYGGFVDSSTTRMMNDDEEVAHLTLEVPSREFDTVMSDLRDGPYVSRIDHESTDSRDVTEEYVDLQSRLGNLEATETRFIALLDEASRIEEILNVEREISRIRGEIEQIKGRINYLEQRTDFSRINVSFYPEVETLHIAGKHFTPGETAREAWDASMQFIGTIGNAVVAFGVFFWWAWPFVLGAVLMLWRYNRRRATAVSGTAP